MASAASSCVPSGWSSSNGYPIINARFPMKTLLRLFACAGFILGAASFAMAATAPGDLQTLRTEEQFKQLKIGDKIGYVCNQCQTVTGKTIESPEQAMDLCKEGGTVTCPSCKAKAHIITRGSPKNTSIERHVYYTNEKGDVCAFVAKFSDGK